MKLGGVKLFDLWWALNRPSIELGDPGCTASATLEELGNGGLLLWRALECPSIELRDPRLGARTTLFKTSLSFWRTELPPFEELGDPSTGTVAALVEHFMLLQSAPIRVSSDISTYHWVRNTQRCEGDEYDSGELHDSTLCQMSAL